MNHNHQFFIGGRWVEPATSGEARRRQSRDRAGLYASIAAGRRAPTSTAPSRRPRRLSRHFADDARRARSRLLKRVLEAYNARGEDIARAVSDEMGAPIAFAREAQVWAGRVHLEATIEALRILRIQPRARHEPDRRGADRRLRADHALELAAEPDRLQGRARARGGLHGRAEAERDRADQRRSSSPRSWRRRERRPACSISSTGRARTSASRWPGHPDVDMVSFTGSTRAGDHRRQGRRRHGQARRAGTRRQVAEHSAARLRFRGRGEGGRARLLQQQRPVLRRADPHAGSRRRATTRRSPSPRRRPRRSWSATPRRRASTSGRWSAETQFDKIQRLIQAGIAEGATLVTGGPGRPARLNVGYYVQPDHVRPRHARDDRRARRNLRARARGHVLSRRGGGDRDRQRHGLWPGRLRLVARSSNTPAASRRGFAPARSTSTIPPGTFTRPSAATSNPATGANTRISASTTIWRPRA